MNRESSKNKKLILISLSGFDGVGKSTQVKLLSDYLKIKGKKVKVTEEMFGYFLLKPLIKILRSASDSLPTGPVKKNINFLPKFWFILAFIDIWIGHLIKIQSLKRKYDFLIADRFYTDIWANLLYYGYIPTWAFSILIKLLPKPDIAFMLQVEPEIVLKREREFPTAYYKEQAQIYKRLADLVDFSTIDASRNPKIVSSAIKSKIIVFL